MPLSFVAQAETYQRALCRSSEYEYLQCYATLYYRFLEADTCSRLFSEQRQEGCMSIYARLIRSRNAARLHRDILHIYNSAMRTYIETCQTFYGFSPF